MRLPSSRLNPPRIARNSAGNISEFGAALFIFLMVIAFPLIDLFGVATGAGVMLFSAHETASAAASQRKYSDCLAVMTTKFASLANGNFGKFVKMHPVGGYAGSGADLFIDASSFVGGASKRFGPNTAVPPPIDLSSNVYECTVQLNCEVGPLLNLSFVPFIGGIPGLGKPAQLTMSASRAAEYPRGLEFPSSTVASASGAIPHFSQDPTVSAPPGMAGSGWNNPNLYEQIKAAGQTVVDEEVVVVQANNPNPTLTSINITSGEKVWVDTRADGLWNAAPFKDNDLDANGMELWSPQAPTATAPYLGQSVLMGRVGTTAQYFFLGVDKLNYPPPGNGTFSMMMNDSNYADNTGAQLVRVVVVK